MQFSPERTAEVGVKPVNTASRAGIELQGLGYEPSWSSTSALSVREGLFTRVFRAACTADMRKWTGGMESVPSSNSCRQPGAMLCRSGVVCQGLQHQHHGVRDLAT